MHIKEPVNFDSLFGFLNDFDTLLKSGCPILFPTSGEFVKGKTVEDILLTLPEDDLVLYDQLEGEETQYHRC